MMTYVHEHVCMHMILRSCLDHFCNKQLEVKRKLDAIDCNPTALIYTKNNFSV